MRATVKKGAQSFLLVTMAIVVACIIAEVFLRVSEDVSTVEYQYDKELGFVLSPNQHSRWVSQDYDVEIVTNSAGFHDHEHSYKKGEGKFRVVVLGDSFLEALQVPIDQGFSVQLQQTLQEKMKGVTVEVINLGLSGLGPAQYYHLLKERGMRYQPDVVIMAVLPDNDFRDSHPKLSGSLFKPYYSIGENGDLRYLPPQASEKSSLVKNFLKRSALLQRFRKLIANNPIEFWLAGIGLLAPEEGVVKDPQVAFIPLDWYVFVQDPPDPWSEAYEITLRMIRETKALSDSIGANFLVMLIGSASMVEDRWQETLKPYRGSHKLEWDFKKPFRAIEVLGNREGFGVINLVEPFRVDFQQHDRSHSFPHDGHWNPHGHQLAAKIMSRMLYSD